LRLKGAGDHHLVGGEGQLGLRRKLSHGDLLEAFLGDDRHGQQHVSPSHLIEIARQLVHPDFQVLQVVLAAPTAQARGFAVAFQTFLAAFGGFGRCGVLWLRFRTSGVVVVGGAVVRGGNDAIHVRVVLLLLLKGRQHRGSRVQRLMGAGELLWGITRPHVIGSRARARIRALIRSRGWRVAAIKGHAAGLGRNRSLHGRARKGGNARIRHDEDSLAVWSRVSPRKLVWSNHVRNSDRESSR